MKIVIEREKHPEHFIVFDELDSEKEILSLERKKLNELEKQFRKKVDAVKNKLWDYIHEHFPETHELDMKINLDEADIAVLERAYRSEAKNDLTKMLLKMISGEIDGNCETCKELDCAGKDMAGPCDG